jgi:hypothetical protein
MGTEKPYIVLWRELAEQTLELEESANWGEYEFEKLSDLIFEKTNTRLSVSTLKRIWERVRYNSNPTTVTLNVLAQVTGFADWRAFKKHADKGKIISPVTTIAKPSTRNRILIPLFLFLVVFAGFFWFILSPKIKHSSSPTYAGVSFQSRIVSNGLPNSVVFNYDASGYHSNNVSIQQSWDPKRREKVSGDAHQHTSIYYYPGYFNAKLVVDGDIKKTSSLFIQTKGWVGIVDKAPSPVYLDSSGIYLHGGLGIIGTSFSSIKGSPEFNDAWVNFYNFKDFGAISGDNFSFETTLRNTATANQSSCRRVSVEIIGTSNAIAIPLADKGCIAVLNISAGDLSINGKDHDWSALGCDFTSFQHLSFTVMNGQLSIELNNKKVLSIPMKQNIGKIVGIRIGFEGPGEIKDVKLSNSQKVFYQQSFIKS